MIDTETVDQVVEQAADQQIEANPEKSPSEIEITPEKQPEPVKPTLENNIRALRESKERIQRERDEMAQRIKELESRGKPQDPEEDLSFFLGESDLAEGKHISKLQKQLKRQQEELIKVQQQNQSMFIETRLKAEHPDIDKVVTKDNIDSLSELYPEVAQALNTSTDYYSKAKAAYTMIKKFGIHTDDTFAADRDLAQRNAAKPRPLASVSPQQAESPLSRANAFANGLTEELKVQLRKEMEEAIRNG